MKKFILFYSILFLFILPLIGLSIPDCTECTYTCVQQATYMYWECRDSGGTPEECQGTYVGSFCGCHNASCASCGPYPACP